MDNDEQAHIEAEFGPFPEVKNVAGVTFDGRDVWFATGDRLRSCDPATGREGRSLAGPATAGTTFDGTCLYQIHESTIRCIDPKTGETTRTIAVPEGVMATGLTWAEGTLWLGDYRGRRLVQIDPESGRTLRTLPSARFVTGVTFVDGELWHGTNEEGASDLRQVDPESGEVRRRLAMPAGTMVSGLEADDRGRFFAGGGPSGKVRVVRRKG